MALQSGHLLINRRRITILGNTAVDVDTGLTQTGRGLDPDPDLAARVMVIPLSPIAAWFVAGVGFLQVSDPFFDTTTQTVHVTITSTFPENTEINVLFWDPHTVLAPVSAEGYV